MAVGNNLIVFFVIVNLRCSECDEYPVRIKEKFPKAQKLLIGLLQIKVFIRMIKLGWQINALPNIFMKKQIFFFKPPSFHGSDQQGRYGERIKERSERIDKRIKPIFLKKTSQML